MFKNYLRIQPAAIQLVIFLMLWCALLLLGVAIQPFYVHLVAGIDRNNVAKFWESEVFKYPNILFGANAIFQIFTFLFPAWVYAYLAHPEPLQYLGGKTPGNKIQPLLVVILAIPLIFVVAILGTWLKTIDLGNTSKELDETRDKIIESYLSNANVWTTLRSILLIAVIPAICEEFFFRGMVFKFAHTLFKKWWVSIGISALIFALFHTTISEFVPILLAGCILGYVYYITSSIWMNVLLHLIFNGLQVVGSMYSNPNVEKSVEQPGTLIGIFVGGLALVAFCLMMLKKVKTPLPDDWSVVKPITIDDIDNIDDIPL